MHLYSRAEADPALEHKRCCNVGERVRRADKGQARPSPQQSSPRQAPQPGPATALARRAVGRQEHPENGSGQCGSSCPDSLELFTYQGRKRSRWPARYHCTERPIIPATTARPRLMTTASCNMGMRVARRGAVDSVRYGPADVRRQRETTGGPAVC
jgi:hypothetical protein